MTFINFPIIFNLFESLFSASKLRIAALFFLTTPFLNIYSKDNNHNSKDILQLEKKIILPNVTGRISQLAYDSKRQLLYFVAQENNSIGIINLLNYSIKKPITSIQKPKEICYINELDKLLVTSGTTGQYFVINANDITSIQSFNIGSKPNFIKYDTISKRIYVGYGNGFINEIDPNTFENMAEYKLDGYPEEFLFHENGNKIFVNVPSMLHFEVIDKTKGKVVLKVKISGATNNFSMAVDTKNRRLFVGCQSPSKIVIFDTETCRQLTSFDCDGDPNSMYFDPKKLRLYVSCGAGFIDIFEQTTGDEFKLIEKRATRNGAKISIYIPGKDLFLVAIPSTLNKPAEINVFSINQP